MEKAAGLAHRLLGLSRRGGPGREGEAPARHGHGLVLYRQARKEQGKPAPGPRPVFRKQGDAFHQVTCAVYLTPCALYQGDFRLARETLKRGFEAHTAIPDEIGGKAGLLLTQAMTALFEGNFPEARENIDQCKQLAGVHSLASIELLSLTIGGLARHGARATWPEQRRC